MRIIDKMRKYLEEKEWDYKFTWGDGKRYGDKYESVDSLAKALGHPKTSMYLSIHQLVKEGFITFDGGLIAYERVLTTELNTGEDTKK